jgi:predicted RND superfamily exporter protein
VDRLARFIVEKRKFFLGLFMLVLAISVLLAPMVRVNYDLTRYLPGDMQISKAISVMEREFGLKGSAQVMVEESNIPRALLFKDKLEHVSGVNQVLWLDDFADVTKPLALIDRDLVEDYYKEGHALFQVIFDEGDHSLKTGSAIQKIEELNDGKIYLRGPAADAFRLRQTATSEVMVIILLVIPIFLLILILSTSSWIEPVLFIAAIGVSILINMGTNALVGEISYITQTTAGLIQFAVTMDYSIFLLHRFGEERAKGVETKAAMINALKHSFSAISASSLTTIAGFAALMFMRYGIGFDMGLVLAKGVALSLLSVLLLLPALVITFEKAIERSHHRPFMPNLKKFARVVLRLRVILPAVALLLPVAYLAQGSNHFLYGGEAVTPQTEMEDVFGRYNPLILMVPSGSIQRESALSAALGDLDGVKDVQALVTVADSSIPREMIPQDIVDNFQSERYSRLTVLLDTGIESAASFAAVGSIRETANRYYPGQFLMVGSSPAVSDIKTVVEYDFVITNLIAIIAVGVIILITFRSVAIPILLIFTIQSSIWMNMAIPYFTGSPLIFIGYMIVSAVQLGATIDYAILLTSKYMYNRRTQTRYEAAEGAICASGNSIITSAAIMSAAGFTLGFISGVPSIAALGMLIGRGALLSCLMVLTLLPQLLMAGDGLIRFSTAGHSFINAKN